VRDIAYRSLLKRHRRQIHVRAARELAGPAAEVGEATDDLIAQHYSRGEAYAEAIVFWQRGAKAAIARSAHEEALAMLDAALSDLKKLPEPEWRAVELDRVMSQANALRSLRGYSAPEVEERLLRARELASSGGDGRSRFNVEWGLFQYTIVKRDIGAARKLAHDLFDHARRHPSLPLVDAYLANGMVALNAGDFEEARSFLEKGVSLSRPETDPPHFFAHGQNPGLFCMSYLARTWCFLGNLDEGRATIERCLAIAAGRAHERAHIYGYANALIHAARVHNLCGDLDAERKFALESNELARSNHYAYYEALSNCHLGWAIGVEGDASEGIAKMLDGIAALERTATLLGLPGFYILLAQLCIRAARWDEAGGALERAVGAAGHAMWDADVERVRGDLFTARNTPDPAAAERSYRASLSIARAQGSGLLAFRAGLSLARLLAAQHRRQEGYEVLAACLERVQGEFGTGDVQDAQVLLKDLAGFG
jgi:tetratricopeptide (TPR) repeat protein